MEIYARDRHDVETATSIRLHDGKFEIVPEQEPKPALQVKLNRSYMDGVVSYRKECIDHPEKLDWDWLKSLLGGEPHYGPSTGADMRPPAGAERLVPVECNGRN